MAKNSPTPGTLAMDDAGNPKIDNAADLRRFLGTKGATIRLLSHPHKTAETAPTFFKDRTVSKVQSKDAILSNDSYMTLSAKSWEFNGSNKAALLVVGGKVEYEFLIVAE